MATKKQQQQQRIAVATACEAFKKELKEMDELSNDYWNSYKKLHDIYIDDQKKLYWMLCDDEGKKLFDEIERINKIINSVEYKKLEAQSDEHFKQSENFKKFHEVLKQNMKSLIILNAINLFHDFLKLYDRKPYGEKTKYKINREFEELTGLSVFLYYEFSSTKIALILNREYHTNFNYQEFEFYLSKENELLDEENKIKTYDNFIFNYKRDEIIPLDKITETIQSWEKEKAELEKEKAELEKRIEEYNSKTFGTFKIK